MGAVGWPGRLLRPTAGQRIVPRALCRVLLCLAMAPVAVHVVRAQMPSSPSGGARLLQSLPRERKSVVTAEDILTHRTTCPEPRVEFRAKKEKKLALMIPRPRSNPRSVRPRSRRTRRPGLKRSVS